MNNEDEQVFCLELIPDILDGAGVKSPLPSMGWNNHGNRRELQELVLRHISRELGHELRGADREIIASP